MPLKLMYITNRPEIAVIAEKSGVDWVFVDLEIKGKIERQGHLDTVISRHQLSDVNRVKLSLQKAQLLVRINPIYEGTAEEIDEVIKGGADLVMLPYFSTSREVKIFVDCINRRAKTCLLCETPGAVLNIDSILDVSGIDYIHIGLNDLHLGYGMKFMFELLTDGTVEKLSFKFRNRNIPFGFGGIAGLGLGALPAEYIIAEHYRLGSQMAILSRSFCNLEEFDNLIHGTRVFEKGISEIRKYESWLQRQDHEWLRQNQVMTAEIVGQIKQKMKISIT